MSEEELLPIVEMLRRYGGEMTMKRIAGVLSPALPKRTLQRRLRCLVKQGRLSQAGASTVTSYKWVADLAPGKPGAAPSTREPVSRALRHLVKAPLELRPQARFDRALLDAYWPGITSYLSAADVTRLQSATPAPAFMLPHGWAVAPDLDPALVELIYAAEGVNEFIECSPQRRQHRNRPVAIYGMLSDPQRRQACPGWWNVREAWTQLLAVSTRETLSFSLAAAVHAAVSASADKKAPGSVKRRGTSQLPACLRTSAMGVRRSTYHPTADPVVIGAGLRQILAAPAAIANPFEAAFMVFSHLLYLQPFVSHNAVMACLLANVPLWRAKMRPMTLGQVPDEDLRDGLLAWFELGRIDVLREVWVAGYRS